MHGGDFVKGRLIFHDCRPVHSFCNRRGRCNIICVDGSGDALNELADGRVLTEFGSVACNGVDKAHGGIPLLLNPPSNRFPLNGESMGSDRGLGRTTRLR